MSTDIVTQPPSDVDALDPDAPAAAQLARDAGSHAHVVREDGCTYIRFDSRDDFRAACAEGVISLDNPFAIQVRGADVIAPVLFGKDGQWRWQAEARYPAQRPCDCAAEVVHQLGCSATEYPEQWMFAGLDEIPVVVVEVPRVDRPSTTSGDILVPTYGSDGEPVYVYSQPIEGAPTGSAWGEPDMRPDDLPRRTPGASIDVHYTNLGLRGTPACGAKKPTVLATVVAANVTCPDCVPLLPARVEPMTRFLRDAYSDVRAAATRELASALIEEAAE